MLPALDQILYQHACEQNVDAQNCETNGEKKGIRFDKWTIESADDFTDQASFYESGIVVEQEMRVRPKIRKAEAPCERHKQHCVYKDGPKCGFSFRTLDQFSAEGQYDAAGHDANQLEHTDLSGGRLL